MNSEGTKKEELSESQKWEIISDSPDFTLVYHYLTSIGKADCLFNNENNPWILSDRNF